MAVIRNRRTRLLLGAAFFCVVPAMPAISQEAPPAGDAYLDEIIVTGVRASLARSIDAKRDAATVIDSISAEELGKFPDRNVADSLGNVPGISVRRTRGAEGQNVSIRGLGQGFSIVTLNERILPTDGAGREFAFDVLPSEMISGADVYKGVQASLMEGGIGGAINLRSARPFDYKEFTAFGSIEGEYNDLSDKYGKKVTGVVADTFANDTIGALVSVSWSKRKIRTDNLREYHITAEHETDNGVDFNGNGAIDEDSPGYVYPDFYSPGTVIGTRERLGITGALQFQPADNFELTIDGLYSNYDTPTRNYAQSNFIEASRFRPGSIKVDQNNVVTDFIIDDLVAEAVSYEEPRSVDTMLFGANAVWNATDALDIVFDGYWGKASRNGAGKERFFVAGVTDASGAFIARDGAMPDFLITLPDGRPLSEAGNDDYRAHYLGITGQDVDDRVYGTKLDTIYSFTDGILDKLKVGISYNDRNKRYDQYGNAATECSFCGYPFTFGEIGADLVRPLPVGDLLKGQKGNFPRHFASFDNQAYLEALRRAENNPAIINPNTGEPYPVGYADQLVARLPGESFDISEKTYAAYSQLDLQSGPWSGNLGLRLIHTKVRSNGAIDQIISITKQPNQTANYDVVRSEATPVSGGGKYTKLLPSLNIAYDIQDDLRLRFAAAQVMSRPSMDQLSPASSDNAETGDFTKYNYGNPDLKPTEANQADISLEWYFAPNSMLAGALFYKDIKNFITTGIDQEVIAGQTFSVVTVDNGDSGKVKGLELTAQYLHDSGFGFAGNVTATKSSARFGEISGKLEDVTPLSVNLSVLYERGPISAKVTYSYDKGRTVQLDGFVEGLSVHGDSYEDLSFSTSYDLTDRVEVFVEGSNLLDETVRQFNTHRNVPAFYEENGRSFFFGMRARY